MISLESTQQGCIILVRAHAAARKTAILGERSGALRVAVTAAPDKGKANRAIGALLAKEFGVSKSSVELVRGSSTSQKKFLLHGLALDEAKLVVQKILPVS